MEPKLTINTPDGNVIIGNQVIKLQDKTSNQFSTTDFDSFVDYVSMKNPRLFYANNAVTAISQSDIDHPTRDSHPFAILNLKESNYLTSMVKCNSEWYEIGAFEELLRKHKRQIGSQGVSLLDNVRNFRLVKTVKVERRKERNGNFHFAATLEGGSKEDFTPPESVIFDLPVFDGINNNSDFELEFFFDFRQDDGEAALKFKLENLNLTEEIREEKERVVRSAFSARSLQISFGQFSFEKKTDEWAYKINQVQL